MLARLNAFLQIALVSAFMLGFLEPASAEPRPATRDDLIGAWELVSLEIDTGGTITKPFGERPTGLLIQSPSRMLFSVVAESREPPAAIALTDEEAARMMKTMTSWGGGYEVDPNPTADGTMFTFHLTVSANQALAGADRVFFNMIEGDLLYVTSRSQPNVQNGQVSVTRVVWRKVD